MSIETIEEGQLHISIIGKPMQISDHLIRKISFRSCNRQNPTYSQFWQMFSHFTRIQSV